MAETDFASIGGDDRRKAFDSEAALDEAEFDVGMISYYVYLHHNPDRCYGG